MLVIPFKVRMVLLVNFLLALHANSQLAIGQNKQSIKTKGVPGLQFQFDDMATVQEFVRANKIVVGGFEFVKMDRGLVIGNLHYPVYNTHGRRTFMVGPLSIKTPDSFPEMRTFTGSLVVRETGKEKVFEAVAYETTKPSKEDRFLKIEGKRRLVFRYRFFSDKDFRYGKLIEDAIGELKSKNLTKKYKSMELLASCGKDASIALKALRENIGTNDYTQISMGIKTLYAIGGEAATKPVAKQVLPEIIRQLLLKNHRQIDAARTAGKLGAAAKKTIPYLIQLLEKNRRQKNQIAGNLIPVVKAMVAIDKNDARVKAAIKPLLGHPYATVRDAATKALAGQ